MGIEIERKFLLKDDAWRARVTRSIRMAQGYLGGTDCSVRVRVAEDGAFLNIKSKQLGVQRLEFEYAIPETDAIEIMRQMCGGTSVVKTRHIVPELDQASSEALCFEIDEFEGSNQGLIVAEIELPSADHVFARPSWLGAEVTDDARYYNSNLISNPYASWRDQIQ